MEKIAKTIKEIIKKSGNIVVLSGTNVMRGHSIRGILNILFSEFLDMLFVHKYSLHFV